MMCLLSFRISAVICIHLVFISSSSSSSLLLLLSFFLFFFYFFTVLNGLEVPVEGQVYVVFVPVRIFCLFFYLFFLGGCLFLNLTVHSGPQEDEPAAIKLKGRRHDTDQNEEDVNANTHERTASGRISH